MNEKINLPQQHETSSIPNSLRERLQRLQLLLTQLEDADENGRDDVPAIRARQAATTIAALITRSPDAGSLAVLADMGYQGYEVDTVEVVEGYVVLETKAFGISFGQRVVPTRTAVRRRFRGSVY